MLLLSSLVYNSVVNLLALYTAFKESLAEDYTYCFQHKEWVIAHWYRRLDTRYFEKAGNKISVLGIELLGTEFCALETKILENSEDVFEPTTSCYENLSNTQQQVSDAIIDRYQNFVQGSNSNNAFLDGPASSGKHFFI